MIRLIIQAKPVAFVTHSETETTKRTGRLDLSLT